MLVLKDLHEVKYFSASTASSHGSMIENICFPCKKKLVFEIIDFILT